MAGYNGPGSVNMCSFDSPDTVVEHFNKHCDFYAAAIDDISMSNLGTKPPTLYGPNTVYSLNWNTYLGWKVYMLMTGCLASDPKQETGHIQKVFDDLSGPLYYGVKVRDILRNEPEAMRAAIILARFFKENI